MMETIDLDAYFRRIGYAGPRTPTLDTLRAIHFRHPQTIPFENLDPLLKRPVRLDLPSLEKKLVASRRGGYCFEQNALFAEVLRQLGFRITPLAARVIWGAPEDAVRPRTHMLLRVDLEDGPYIADVGFGGATATGPLRLVPDIEQTTPHEPFRLIRTGQPEGLVSTDDEFRKQVWLRDRWKTLYRFGLQPQLPPDYEIANWYVSTYPPSHFINDLVAARTTADRRFALLNGQLSIHHLRGASEQRVLSSVDEVRTVLEETFELSLPEGDELNEALARALARPVAEKA